MKSSIKILLALSTLAYATDALAYEGQKSKNAAQDQSSMHKHMQGMMKTMKQMQKHMDAMMQSKSDPKMKEHMQKMKENLDQMNQHMQEMMGNKSATSSVPEEKMKGMDMPEMKQDSGKY
jgi:hypothetical protein